MVRSPRLFSPLALPNGARLKNRIVKSAMSDGLGDGRGNPTEAQARLYRRWAEGGVAASIVGEVQGDARFAEAPGNLVLDETTQGPAFAKLAHHGSAQGTQFWFQLGHAGALTPPAIGAPAGPSRLEQPGLHAAELSRQELRALPSRFAASARRAERAGVSGVQIHAAHGFLLSQFLSPLFNRRGDAYGGNIANRMRLLLEVIEAVRAAVTSDFTVSVKLNASDQLAGGLTAEDALAVVAELDQRGIDLIDISGGTYFPGAASSSDRAGTGPYFLDFAAAARRVSTLPLMVTGGFKRRREAEAAIESGTVDAVGLARALVLEPALPEIWNSGGTDPVFPRFADAPPGGVTAWFTMRLAALAEPCEAETTLTLADAVRASRGRDASRLRSWQQAFGHHGCGRP